MSQQVHVFNQETIEKMKVYYEAFLQNPPPGAQFRAKTDKAVITAYRSGKVLFQGSSPEEEAGKWTDVKSENEQLAKGDKPKAEHSYTPPGSLFKNSHIGSDETGTGDYFGPITVCACYVPEERIALLKEVGVQDSKNLTDEKINVLSKKILQLDIPYSLLVLSNDKYNRFQQQGWTQGKMKTILHHQAIVNVRKKIEDKHLAGIVVDQFCEPHVYQKHLQTENKSMTEQTYFMTKAESYSIAVATASIIARTSFVKKMDELSEKAGIYLPKGASAQVDRAAANFMKRYGKEKLKSFAKLHFANTKKAYKYL